MTGPITAPRTGWWRRNAIALVALAVLVPATVWAISGSQAAEDSGALGNAPIDVASGATVEYAGSTLGPATASWGSDPSAPAGSRVLEITVPVDGDLGCDTVLRDAAGRQWDEASADLGVDFDADRITTCGVADSTHYDLSLVYLVPDGATGPFVLDVVSGAALPSFARFALSP